MRMDRRINVKVTGMSVHSKKEDKALLYHLFRMVSVGVIDEPVNQAYDIVSTSALILNLIVTILNTYSYLSGRFGTVFSVIEKVTVALFAIDYVLRVITARYLYPDVSVPKATFKYLISFTGVIDLLSFLPFYLPVFFPAGAAAFRMFRVARILRLFRINEYFDSLNVITEVIVSKKQQLLSSVFIIVVLMVASSLCMYSVENPVQPEVFSNAFSGIWWSASTLLTVGYGDIYPITVMGKILGILIAFLGVGVVAIPTGIISAGFVEQYTRLKRMGDYAMEEDIHFIQLEISEGDSWNGRSIKDLGLPKGAIVAVIQRGDGIVIPKGNVTLNSGDKIIIAAKSMDDDSPVELKEIVLKKDHEWNDTAIKDLDISRQSFIVLVNRGGDVMLPKGSMILRENDKVLFYHKSSSKNERGAAID